MADASSCLQCGDELETWGIFGNVVPTFFCKRCCTAFRHARDAPAESICGRYTVSKSRALSYYGCTRDDLKQLNSGVAADRRRNDSTQLYLGAEVDFMGAQTNLERKLHLERELDVNLRDMDPTLRVFLLGDYLHRQKPRKTSLNEVRRRYEVIDRVVTILLSCKNADPGATFDFCLAYPDGGVEEFQDLRERCRRVFRLEGRRILDKLSPEDKAKLTKTPLADIVNNKCRDPT